MVQSETKTYSFALKKSPKVIPFHHYFQFCLYLLPEELSDVTEATLSPCVMLIMDAEYTVMVVLLVVDEDDEDDEDDEEVVEVP